MTKKEILLKQRNAENVPLTDYISTDGYVWKMVENAMEEYHQAKLKLLDISDIMCRHEKTTKHIMTGIRYCSNPKCQKLIDIE